MKWILYFFFLSFLVSGCELVPKEAPKFPGMAYTRTDAPPPRAIEMLEEVLANNPNLTVLGKLRSTEKDPSFAMVYFGNSSIETPLMMNNRLTALDLPQRMLAISDGQDGSYLVFNELRFLEESYGLSGLEETGKMEKAMDQLGQVLGDTLHYEKVASFAPNKGVYTRKSGLTFRETYQLILDRAVDLGLEVLFEVDQGANAAEAGLDLPPTRLIMLDAPELRTALLNENPTLALDVWPLKILVWEDESGLTRVSRHRLVFHYERRKLNTNSRNFVQTRNILLDLMKDFKRQGGNATRDLPS